VRRVCFASIREHPPPGLAWLGQPFAIAGTAMLMPQTGACLLRVLAAMICLLVLIEWISEQARSNRYRHGVSHLASCRRLGGAIEAWGVIPKHNSYINELLCAYGHRVGFMKQLDRDTHLLSKSPGVELGADWMN
jgi:hypothetical protein